MSDSIVSRVEQHDIIAGLQKIGLDSGDSILVHSSLSSFGYVVGGSHAVIDALLAVVGESGNVLVPTLTGTRNDGPDHPPQFDVRTAPCWTGRIPNDFMQRHEAHRSLHPTHSIAGIGPMVREFSVGHEDSPTPCGPASPYFRLAEHGGYILLLGVGQESNTTLHTAEELTAVSYHMQPEPTDTVIIDYEGKRHVKRLYLHDWGTPRDFQRIDTPLLELGIMTIGHIGQAEVRLIRSAHMLEWLVERLKQEPRYLCK